jgi:hypothetical protein
MAKGKKENEQTLTNPKLPRIIGSSSRSIKFSSPAPGRPKIFWLEGINPGIVRELWPSQEELPYEERELPLHISSTSPNGHRLRKCYRFGVTRKMVVYERTHPEIRLVLFLGSPYDREGETWQPIVQSRVERDRGVDPRQSRRREERLWAEVCRVERRGRPRGTGHPKNPILREFPISTKNIARLRREGLDDRDLRVLFGRWDNKKFKQIGRELGMSAQAVWKRWKRRIEPAIKRVNPSFSSGSFQLSSLDSK